MTNEDFFKFAIEHPEQVDNHNVKILGAHCLSLLEQLRVAEEALQFEALTDEPSAIRAKHTLERMGKT